MQGFQAFRNRFTFMSHSVPSYSTNYADEMQLDWCKRMVWYYRLSFAV